VGRHVSAILAKLGAATRGEAAALLGIDQPKISALVRGRLGGFSLQRLMRFLNLLGRDVQIVVTPKPKGRRHAILSVV
jgi:predicted XRE-type DNA-binding protein